MFTKTLPFLLLFLTGCATKDISPPLSPQQELASFQLDDQLSIELIASEPLVQDPVAMSFDEDGRLWVVEMRSFMPDIDGNGEETPLGRVNILLDQNEDGIMDTQHIFLDSLILPRAIACTKGGILIAENKPLWFAKDTNGDFRADIKILIDSTYGGRGLIEHSPNGLWRGMDNWFYNAKADFKYAFNGQEWIKEKTEFRGQWGMSHDDAGRLFYNYNWSQLHADLVPPGYLNRNPYHTPTSGIDEGLTLNRSVYPIRSNTAVNRGYVPGTLDEKGQLLEFASACSPFVFRGDGMHEVFRGNAFVCEPTANLIKRNILTESDWHIDAKDAYDKREFLASTDERFRPVFLASGPDGALYIADMYRGIIQHGPYMTPYLREITLNRQLDKHINMGRIWRIKQSQGQKIPVQKLSQKNGEALVEFLSHTNGWYRDVAQRLLVERGDQSIIPYLKSTFSKKIPPFARLHILWTLEGLRYEEADIYLGALNDSDVFVQCAAIRILESLSTRNNRIQLRFQEALLNIEEHAAPSVQLQIALSSRIFPSDIQLKLLEKFVRTYLHSPIARDVILSNLENKAGEMLDLIWDWQDASPDKEIFIEMLARALINQGASKEVERLLTKFEPNEAPFSWKQTAILNGMLTHNRNAEEGPIILPSKPQILTNSSPKNIHSFHQLFSWPGKPAKIENEASTSQVSPATLALGRQQYLTVCAACHGTDGRGLRRFAPPLAQSEWVVGSEKQLILLLLQGMQGAVEVNGKTYDVPDILPQMPSFTVLDNQDLAAIMTYIRQAWGNQATEVEAGRVGHIRYRSQGKITPWTAEELRGVSEEEIE